MILKKHLPRRTFLKGAGATVALPFLDAMLPAMLRAAAAAPKARLAVLYVPNGIIMEDWKPAAAGRDYALGKILEPVSAFKDDFLLLTGLTQNGGRALGDGPGDHARAAANFLTGAHCKKTAGADIRNGISCDQVAANAIGGQTRFPSLELGCEKTGFAGNCDSGYSCAYANNLSWKSETTPLPPEVNPRAVFERLFGSYEGPRDPASVAKRHLYAKSILDIVSEDTRQLRGALGPTDRRKLDEYLDAVRGIERRIESAEKNSGEPAVDPGMAAPSGVPSDFAEHLHLMFDLMTIAFQADLTRIVTIMIGREGSNRTYREIGIAENHHGLTHHRGDPEKIAKITRINRYHVEQLAYFLGKLKSTKDGGGTLLDHSMVLYGGGLSDGNDHLHEDLPILLAGRGSGAFRPGRHVVYPKETPTTNLYLAMLDQLGVRPEKIGDSTGRLDYLTDLG